MRKHVGTTIVVFMMILCFGNLLYRSYTQSKRHVDGERVLYMTELGMLKWMRACAYASGQRLDSREVMEKKCSINLGVKGAGK